MTAEELELCGDRLDSVRDLLELLPNEIGSWKYAYWYKVYTHLYDKLEAAENDAELTLQLKKAELTLQRKFKE